MKKSKIISMLLVVSGLALLTTGGLSVFAATTATQNLSFTNPTTASVTLTGDAVSFDPIEVGVAKDAPDAATVTATSNAEWTLTLTGTDFTNGSNTIAKDDCLQVRADTNPYADIGTGIALAANHAASSTDFVMDYQLNVPTNTAGAPGSYGATLTYTISN